MSYDKRPACMEPLERRLMRDGTVQAAIEDGDLVIRGDRSDNVVLVHRVSGKIRVTGLDGTKVGGATFKEFAPTFDDLEIRMRQGGVDEVSVRGGMTITGSLDAQLGDGLLAVEGSSAALEIGDDLVVRGGEECDVHLRNDTIVRGIADIITGGDVTFIAANSVVPDVAAARFSDPLDIDNPYFPLVPGTQHVYEEKSLDDETGEVVTQRIVVDVLNQTKTIMGVTTRVLRDRVFEDGLLIEDTFDWHAQDDAGNVWYFGERTVAFEYDDEGELISSTVEGSWQAGIAGAKPGVAMPANPQVGMRYYQEFAPGEALDFAEVISRNATARTPVSTFNGALRTEDINLLDPAGLEHKFYAPGVGMVQELGFNRESGDVEGTLKLISLKLNGNPVTQVVPPTGFSGTNATGRSTGPVHVFGETQIEAGGAVHVEGARLHDEIFITTESTVDLVNTQLEDVELHVGDNVGLRNITATEEVFIRGNVDVYIFASTFQGLVDIRLGSGSNELVVRGSSFVRLFADGGGGENEFDDRGNNDFDDLDLVRFEEA